MEVVRGASPYYLCAVFTISCEPIIISKYEVKKKENNIMDNIMILGNFNEKDTFLKKT